MRVGDYQKPLLQSRPADGSREALGELKLFQTRYRERIGDNSYRRHRSAPEFSSFITTVE